MRIFAKQNGHYIGVDPSVPNHIYAFGQNGDTRTGPAGAWEEIELTIHADQGNQADLLFVSANVQLSLTPNGLDTRPAKAVGLWELVDATAQPNGMNLVLRNENGVVVSGFGLTIEAKS